MRDRKDAALDAARLAQARRVKPAHVIRRSLGHRVYRIEPDPQPTALKSDEDCTAWIAEWREAGDL